VPKTASTEATSDQRSHEVDPRRPQGMTIPVGGVKTDKIVISGVRKIYSTGGADIEALAGIDLAIGDGSFCSVVGPSGCGKSTLLRMLAGLETPTEGELRMRQRDDSRALVAVAFQDYSIFPWKTVEANVAFGLRARGVDRTAAKAISLQWIEKLGLRGFERAYPQSLSGGMKQRVALARVFALDPEIMLLDEPFAALDAQLRQLLQEDLLAQWEQERERTAMFVTHSLDEAILLGDQVVLMSARPGRIKKIYEVPFGRPRTPEIRRTAQFAEFREELWQELKTEVDRQNRGEVSQ
jgi:NitT/TauT family transport system ATP-binding protein